MSERIGDGASVSLDRQLDMVRFIHRGRGRLYSEITFYMRARHGVSQAWVTKYLKEWAAWGVVVQRGQKFHVDEEKWKLVLQARDLGFDVYGPE